MSMTASFSISFIWEQVYTLKWPKTGRLSTQVLGTAGEVLDAEVLRVAAQLPTAVSPARLRGQPVRVYYIIPVSFKIQQISDFRR